MPLRKSFVEGILKVLDQRLRVAGFSRRRIGIYVEKPAAPIGGNAFGWLGLNTASYIDGARVNPVVGVRFEPLERLRVELVQETYGAVAPPTVSSPLGYLMPAKHYEVWHFTTEENPQPAVEAMLDAFIQFGLPFINGHRDIAAIVGFLERTRTMTPWNVATRLPLALRLAGRPADADEALKREEAQLGDRHDEAAKQYRFFAQRYRQRFGSEAAPDRKTQ